MSTLRDTWSRLLTRHPLLARLAHGSFWMVTGTACSKALTWVATVLVARFIGQEAFGQLGLLLNTVSMGLVFADFGMTHTSTRFVAEYRTRDPARAGRIIALSLWSAWLIGGFVSLLFFALAPWLARAALGQPQLSVLLQATAPMLLLGALNSAQNGALVGFEAFRGQAVANALAGVTGFFCVVGLTRLAGLAGAVLGQILLWTSLCVFGALVLRRTLRKRDVRIDYRGARDEARLLWTFSLPAVLSSGLFGPVHWLCLTAVSRLPGGAAELGAYNAATQMQIVIGFTAGVLANVGFPMLANLAAPGDRVRFLAVLRGQLRINTLLPLLAALALAVPAPLWMGLYGPSFRAYGSVLALLAASGCVVSVSAVLGMAILTLNRLWPTMWLRVGWSLVALAATLALAPRWGAAGLSLALLFANLLHLAAQGLYLRRLLRAPAASGKTP